MSRSVVSRRNNAPSPPRRIPERAVALFFIIAYGKIVVKICHFAQLYKLRGCDVFKIMKMGLQAKKQFTKRRGCVIIY